MIVDDHADMRRMLRSVVSFSTQQQLEIMECSSGEEAVSEYPGFKPDYVLMDIELGGINGFQTIEQLYENNPEAKVLIITSHDSTSFRKRAKKLNTIGYVIKDDLSNINEYLSNTTT